MILFYTVYSGYIESSKLLIAYLVIKFSVGKCDQNYLKDVIIDYDKLKTPSTFEHINYKITMMNMEFY